ncbi:MAG: hypothetical protein OXN21_06755 [Chloroflexota bacterium]|nr:hypothetical protein [Chloroflexota bacterium]
MPTRKDLPHTLEEGFKRQGRVRTGSRELHADATGQMLHSPQIDSQRALCYIVSTLPEHQPQEILSEVREHSKAV